MDGTGANDTERANRILAEKLQLLYRGNFAVPANFAIACFVAYLLSDTYPKLVLSLWLATTTAVVGLRIYLYRRFLKAAAASPCSACWARIFCLGAFASGALWGAMALMLPVWGSETDYIVLMLVISGVSAGALTTIVTYLPAFFSYAGTMVLPMAWGLLQYHDPKIAATGWLMLLFFVVIGLAAKNLSHSAVESIELHVDNEALNASLKRAEAERDAARTEKWSTLAQLSHELRTPLNAIIGFSEAMHREYFGPLGSVRYKDYSAHVHASGKHVLTLIDEILQLSQGEAGSLTLNESELEVWAVVAGAVEMMRPAAQESGLELRSEVVRGLPRLKADEAKVRRMLLSLIHNAVKFTPKLGEIVVAASSREDGGIELKVSDTGIGMMAEDIPLAMLPFGRLANPLKHENEGMGVGLPLCKRLAELHGAEFRLESEPGEGTTCTISFPASRSVRSKAASQAA